MNWENFSRDTIIKKHGDIYKYRDLYKGRHAEYSPRAKDLINRGEIIDFLEHGEQVATNVRTPYLIANISKIICDVPALLISRSIGDVLTNHKNVVMENTMDEDAIEEAQENDEEAAIEPKDLQQEMLNQIVDNSGLRPKHKQNILQHQIDGGVVGVPQLINQKPSIDFKDRSVYFPHEDNQGCDLMYEMDIEDDNGNDYVHQYTERELENSLETEHRLYTRNKLGKLVEVTDVSTVKDVLKKDVLKKEYIGRHRSFIRYFGNNVTHIDPYGVSELEGQESKQEEINWTITRTAITFERNGKPRISVSPDIMHRLRQIAEETYGDPEKIDHRNLEVTEMDQEGRSIELHQIDISRIGDMDYVKDIIRMMLTETNTSENATEFLNEKAASASAQSGIAKFYDLFISLVKAESIRNEYIEFLRELFEGALWLVNNNVSDSIIVEKPYIVTDSMIPRTKSEEDENNINKYSSGTQSLETTIRMMHPDKADDWVDDEIQRIKDESASDDTLSLRTGRQRLQGLFGNRDAQGRPLNEDGTPRTNRRDEENPEEGGEETNE